MKSILEIIGDNRIGSAEDMGGNDKVKSGDGDDTNYGDNLDGTGIGGNDQINSGAVLMKTMAAVATIGSRVARETTLTMVMVEMTR